MQPTGKHISITKAQDKRWLTKKEPVKATQAFQQKISQKIKDEPNYATLANSIVDAAKEISTEIEKIKPEWFKGSKHELILLIDVRKTMHTDFIKQDIQRNQVHLKDTQHQLKREMEMQSDSGS
jgi:hypothetical protein